MVYLGYILPPQNQKIYDGDVALALANYKKDLLNAKLEKAVASGDTNTIQSILSKIQDVKVDNVVKSVSITNDEKKDKVPSVNDLVDLSEVKPTPAVINTDLDGIKTNNFLNELKTKISSENKGLKKPVFNNNLVSDNVPVNTLMQELKLKLQKPNMGLKEKLNEAREIVRENSQNVIKDVLEQMVGEVEDENERESISKDVLEKVVEKVVEENKDYIFESFNKSLIDKPTIESFGEAHTYASSTMNDFDEQYLRWNKNNKVVLSQILKDTMEKFKFKKIIIYNNKNRPNQNYSNIVFIDDIAKINGKKTKKELSERQLLYTLLSYTQTGKIVGEGLTKGKGVSATNGEKNFGNFHLSLPALRKGNLTIYRPRSNTALISRRNISPLLIKVINSIRSDMKFELDDYNHLKVMEQKVIDHIINLLNMDYPPKMKRALDEENWHLKQRYEILLSEINAGNGGYMVVNELKGVLAKLKENKVINKRKYDMIVSALN